MFQFSVFASDLPNLNDRIGDAGRSRIVHGVQAKKDFVQLPAVYDGMPIVALVAYEVEIGFNTSSHIVKLRADAICGAAGYKGAEISQTTFKCLDAKYVYTKQQNGKYPWHFLNATGRTDYAGPDKYNDVFQLLTMKSMRKEKIWSTHHGCIFELLSCER